MTRISTEVNINIDIIHPRGIGNCVIFSPICTSMRVGIGRAVLPTHVGGLGACPRVIYKMAEERLESGKFTLILS